MSKVDDRAHSVGPDDEPPGRGLRERLARLRAALQDRLWADHEKWTADRGYQSWRSPSGWTAYGRDPRFDLRQECRSCDGTGRDRITGAECPACDDGVVTLDPPEDGEWS
jgi:hypothetical protein